MQSPAEKCPQVLFLDGGTRSQASNSDYCYNSAANCDTSMKIGRDGQFDMLKKIRCRPDSLMMMMMMMNDSNSD